MSENIKSENVNEMQDRILAEAEEFLKKHDLSEIIQSFLSSEKTANITKNGFKELMNKIEFFKAKVPESLKEKSEKVHNVFMENEPQFHLDIAANLKIKISMGFKLLPDSILEEMSTTGLLKRSIADAEEAYLKDITDITDQFVRMHVNAFMEEVYDGYIEQKFPKEVADILTMITGGKGVMIPFDGIFSEPDQDEKGSKKRKRNSKKGNAKK